jgi:hypothetical protein
MSKNLNIFNTVKIQPPQRSKFDLSHTVTMSGNMGNLIPAVALECVPGDSHNLSADSLIRFAPLLAPIMQRMDVRIEWFFCPNRILWRNWDDWFTQKNPSAVHPYFNATNIAEGTLADYMGLPSVVNGNLKINPFPFAAYQKIYNEYYRDQNLIASVIGDDELLVDGDNNANVVPLTALRRRAWAHDQFTSALPSPQSGDPVTLPVSIIYNGAGANNQILRHPSSGAVYPGVDVGSASVSGSLSAYQLGTSTILNTANIDLNGTHSVSGIDVQNLRKASRLQELKEMIMRAGKRLKETIMSQFGVDPGDARLQRPEYINGVKAPVVVSEVLNTTGAPDSNPQGAMAGHGVAVNVGNADSYYDVKEHGWIIGIISVMPTASYQDGMHRSLHRRMNVYDYLTPKLANIGEQVVYMSELRSASLNPDTQFGYTPMYSEYRYMPNRIAGNFRSSLDFWHCGRKFPNDPALNQTFIEFDPSSVDRIFAVKPEASTHSIYMQVLNKIYSVRPLPKFGTPTL